ncbi:MAG: osmotically inducible protein C [Elusimicrobia bacterium CG1_02_63_36]|nr:MAG: osmotically inducible protein C [Elusimicrobia bacterium CG1_02_63_36]PIP83831.1 MAG: osmotically inducible protein C [Elusimicrobia bacterium CG22_combo_CG10-13_8_21_14_all_63_91]PJA16888.1 MAG: osmotically inducible protein C [Elusimicrobia bacterium CG_4_10_14_0_2_um_filter_63_34]PJB24920.1 MAG: osmotically inducible protein C [Elusimicrobia bacterium CG_4_9_14_3_um_filter_62_55]
MEMKITFPGGKKVAASFNGQTVMTDQPKEAGGDGSAPAPFELFLASLGTCAGIFVLSFCKKRELPTEGLSITQTAHWDDAEHRVSKVSLKIHLPKGFPEKYRESVISTANLCTVKKHLAKPPEFEIETEEG